MIARFVSYESPFDQCPYPPKVVCKDSKSWGFSASPPPCIIRASGRSLANLSWLASATEARYVVKRFWKKSRETRTVGVPIDSWMSA